jgi:hypothetical protein
MLQRCVLACVLTLLATSVQADPERFAIPVAYEGTYGILATPTGSLLDALGVQGVVEIVHTGDELHVSLPGHAPVRFVAAGRHRFVSPDDRSILTFEVAEGRVRRAFLDGHGETALVPVNPWQAALARLARQIALIVPPGGPDGPD